MYINFTFILLLSLFSCDNKDDSIEQLAITEEAISGDWLRSSYYIGLTGDTDGSSGISKDLLNDLTDCKKDDILRYQTSASINSNKLIFGISSLPCEGEEANDFISAGTWSLSNNSIVHFINDFAQSFEIVFLNHNKLRIKSSGTNTENGIVYTFSEYDRIN